MSRPVLTEKQEEALLLAGEGLTVAEMAERLAVHPSAVEQRLARVRRELGVKRKNGLILASRKYFNTRV